MDEFPVLDRYLDAWAGGDARRNEVAATIASIAEATVSIAELVALGPLAGQLAAVVGRNAGGDEQNDLDVRTNEIIFAALRKAPVAVVGSEEEASPVVLDEHAPLGVALDPLDGSSNVATNVSIGTIFSVLPVATSGTLEATLLQPGTEQLAAGFVLYGPQTALVLSVGAGTQFFTLDRRTSAFRLTRPDLQIAQGNGEFAINASNYRHWDEAIRTYVDDCFAGVEGPRRQDFNMRWIASLVAEAFRILAKGGIYLYPRDARPGYQNGRLRLVYEANPIAMLIEQAGGAATDGVNRILEIVPRELHQRVPLVFGSREKVERAARYHTGGLAIGERSPLFGRRGLFRV
jgi:fructose-1,6-bisphosphatase I